MLRFLVIVSVMFSFASSAQAHDYRIVPTDDPLLREAVTVADHFWAKHGFHANCEAVLYLYNSQNEAQAERGGCAILISRHYYLGMRRLLRQRVVKPRLALTFLCAVMVHERGHNIGFDHEHGGIMSEVRSDRAPSECIEWARTISVK